MVCQKINMHICSYNYTLLGPDNCTITDTDLVLNQTISV